MERQPGQHEPNIVVIGGGTGSFTLLTGLKEVTPNLTAVVNMADDGGSTGILRDELGVLPPGDVRQCLVALARNPMARDLFTYRYGPDDGSLAGHSFGNLFLATLGQLKDGDFGAAVKAAGQFLNITGAVLPATLDNVTLEIEFPDGQTIHGEHHLDHGVVFSAQRPEVRLVPPASITDEATRAIQEADLVVVAPGSLYGSLAAVLAVGGMSEALRTTKAKKAFVCNLVTEEGQTDGFSVNDYAEEIIRFMGGVNLDYVLYNTHKPPQDLLARYKEEHRTWVHLDPDESSEEPVYQTVGRNFVAAVSSNHPTLIRHNQARIAHSLLQIANGEEL